MYDLNAPEMGPNIPRRSTPFYQWLGKVILRVLGWHVEGEMPNMKKWILVLAPHTSNWDGFIAVCTMMACDLDAHWFVKGELVRWPFVRFLEGLGAVGINRASPHGLVNEVVKLIKSQEKFMLTITPEGTRSKVEGFKPGFYWIAQKADMPIQLGWWDFRKKTFNFGPMVEITNKRKVDIPQIEAFYKAEWAKYPEKF